MTKSIIKTVIFGIVVGALAFFAPHVLLGLFIFMLIARMLCGCGRGRCCSHRRGGKFEMLDKLRSMSDAEFAEFKNNHGMGCCGSKSKCDSDAKCDSDSKKTETTK